MRTTADRPTREEMDSCHPYLEQELEILGNVTTVLCLGRIAYGSACRLYGVKRERFGHNRLFRYDGVQILTSYHPSRQNTQTGRLGWREWSDVFERASMLVR